MFQLPRKITSDGVKSLAREYIVNRKYEDAYSLLQRHEMIPPNDKPPLSKDLIWWNAEKNQIPHQISECCWLASLCITCTTNIFQGETIITQAIKLAQYALELLPEYEEKIYPFYREMVEHRIKLLTESLQDFRRNPRGYSQLSPATQKVATPPSEPSRAGTVESSCSEYSKENIYSGRRKKK